MRGFVSAWVGLAALVCSLGGCDPSSSDTGATDTTGPIGTTEASSGPTTMDSVDGSGSSGANADCPIAGMMGGEPGQIVPAVIASRCDGTTVSLPELVCGHPLTLVDIGGASFDICVEATEQYATAPEYDDLQARGLQIVQIFALDDQNNIPSSTFCSEYAAEHGVDFEFLIDQIGATHSLAPFYPFNLVVDAQGQVVHQWTDPIPEDKVEILGALLDAAAR